MKAFARPIARLRPRLPVIMWSAFASLLHEDYLNLSTIHSAKGQECKPVFVLVVGCMPSDLGTGQSHEIEEDQRPIYVELARAKNELHLMRCRSGSSRTVKTACVIAMPTQHAIASSGRPCSLSFRVRPCPCLAPLQPNRSESARRRRLTSRRACAASEATFRKQASYAMTLNLQFPVFPGMTCPASPVNSVSDDPDK